MIITRHFAVVASLQQPAAMAPGRGMQCGGEQHCYRNIKTTMKSAQVSLPVGPTW